MGTYVYALLIGGLAIGAGYFLWRARRSGMDSANLKHAEDDLEAVKRMAEGAQDNSDSRAERTGKLRDGRRQL